MRTSSGADIAVDGDVVVKTHRVGTDPVELAARLRIAALLGRAGGGPLLAPLGTVPQPAPDQRWTSSWPRLSAVARTLGDLPWPQAGALLAALHRCTPPPAPAHRGVARLRAALQRLPAGAPAVIGAAAAALPERAWQVSPPGRPVTLVHGDFHLGQLVRRPGEPWQLIDVDDLGIGDPVWDLARPAGLWAAGLIPHEDWAAFLEGYRAAGGPAVPRVGDPWITLDPVARAAVVHAAAVGARYPEDESQTELLAACARMA